MTKYINRQLMIDAYRLTGQAGPVPPWLLRPQFVRVMTEGGEVDYAMVHNTDAGKVTRVYIGDWVIDDRGVLIKMTDKEFTDKYAMASIDELFGVDDQKDLFRGFADFEVEPDDGEDGDWFAYDSGKPASMMSVRDHVFFELLKMRMQVWGREVDDLLDDHIDKVEKTLTAMGYD